MVMAKAKVMENRENLTENNARYDESVKPKYYAINVSKFRL
jgi:hypothetical protein